MNYSAKASLSFEDNDSLQLIHLNPFGSSTVTTQTNEKTLLPNYKKKIFYIGLSKAQARDNVPILFQVSEGSEDPSLSSFGPFDKIEWAVLTANDNPWLKLSEEHIIQNTTNNFLKSGIIQFSLPKESSVSNFLLDDGLIWLKAELGKKPDAVARFVGVHAQASTATFENNNNVFDHLDVGLPAGTIKQLAQRKSKIKGIQQPYTSFGGKNTETDTNFYRRISERLRHKDRAVTLWDYERLTLEAFPKIHKVKCLNHTKFENNEVDELCPGHVTLVVLPKVTGANATFGLYPSVSQNTKDEIKQHLAPKHGLHVNLDVVNPIYELVQFDFNVRFYSVYDYNFYKGILEQDLIALLAPWAFDDSAEIKFNNTLYEYDMVNFIENLTYVDFVENFKMNHILEEGVINPEKRIRPTNALAVLAPTQSHLIKEAENC
ncbi:MAG: phage baseplate protein, partial [Pricia sp.]|nr:phage baseplate protein [Pricia sp.]